MERFREDRFEIEVAAPPGAVPPNMLCDVRDETAGSDGTAGHTTLAVSADRLHDVLELLVRDRVPLVSVTPVQPDLEEVFVRLVETDG